MAATDGSANHGARAVAVGTLASRTTGLVRTLILVWVVGGTSAEVGGQAFSVANELPTNLYALIAGGALGAVLLPQLVRSPHAVAVAERIVTIAVTGSAAITIALTLGTPWLIRLYAASWPTSWLQLTIVMAYWCMPQVFFYVLFAVLSQVLNARGRYREAAWAPTAANLIQVAGLLTILGAGGVGPGVDAWSPGRIALLCGTSTLGVAIQAAIVWWATARGGTSLRFRWGFQGLASPTRLGAWTFAGVVVSQLNFVVLTNTTTAAGLALNRAGIEGASMNSLSNAYLLIMVPFGVIVISVITVVYTRMNVSHARGDVTGMVVTMSNAAEQISVVCWWAAALFAALGPQLSTLLWGTPIIGNVAAILGVPLMSMGQVTLSNRVALILDRGPDLFWTQSLVAAVTSLGCFAALLWLPPVHVVYGIAVATVVANASGAALGRALIERHSAQASSPIRLQRRPTHVVAVMAGAVVAAAVGRLVVEAGTLMSGGARLGLLALLPTAALLASLAYVLMLVAFGKRSMIRSVLRRGGA